MVIAGILAEVAEDERFRNGREGGFLGGAGFKYFIFSTLPGEMIQFDKYFSNGLKPPTSFIVLVFVPHILGGCPYCP